MKTLGIGKRAPKNLTDYASSSKLCSRAYGEAGYRDLIVRLKSRPKSCWKIELKHTVRAPVPVGVSAYPHIPQRVTVVKDIFVKAVCYSVLADSCPCEDLIYLRLNTGKVVNFCRMICSAVF